jgi:ribose transport system permease protein
MVRELTRIFPNSLFLSIPVILICWHLLNRTTFGQHTFAIGGSMEAAKRAGIDVKRHLIKVYVLSSVLAGIAGVFNVFQTGIGNFTPFNAMYELFAVAAVVIGGASLSGGKGRVMGSIVGVLLLGVLENGLAISGVQAFFRFIAVGLILIVAVVIDQLFPDLL